jgi:hypothetical protein
LFDYWIAEKKASAGACDAMMQESVEAGISGCTRTAIFSILAQ